MNISRGRKALLAGFVGLAMAVGGAATANAATTEPAPESSTVENASERRAATHSDCMVGVVPEPGNITRGAVSMVCSDIDEGVQVRGVLDIVFGFDQYTPWIDPSQIGQTVVSDKWIDSSGVNGWWVEERVDPNYPGTMCMSKIVVTKERTFGPDEHAAELTCSSVAEGIMVRAVGDFTLQRDTHSDYLTAAGTARSPGQTREGVAMPTARNDYALR